jgi:uncharacterized protein
MKHRLYLAVPGILYVLLHLACTPPAEGDALTTEESSYLEAHEQWRKTRLERLRGPRNWLSLAGLYPVGAGLTSFGSSDTNDIVFPPQAPGHIGFLYRSMDEYSMTITPPVAVFVGEKKYAHFDAGIITPDDGTLYQADPFFWTFIERSGQHYIRLWDTLSEARHTLTSIPAFPVDPAWRIETTYTPAAPESTIVLDDVLGLRRPYALEGTLSGAWRDTAFTLLALKEDDSLFIIFDDATTDIETYPAGRYLHVAKPQQDSTRVILDFNRAYNPPCAFTEFATCLLPPDENKLPFAVRAGEKTVGH